MSPDIAEIVSAIAAARPVPGGEATVVAIDGLGGAGKTTLADRVIDALPGTVVHTDDFASWDNPQEWWPLLIEQVLLPLSRNEAGRYRRYDWDARHLAEWHTVEPRGLVVIEGVSSSRAAFRPYLSLAVWIDAPRELRLQRGLERDGEDMRDQWLEWMASEEAWAAEEDPRSHADLIISSELNPRPGAEGPPLS